MTPLKITKYALEKAHEYARLAYKHQRSECYGWLLTPRGGNDFVVRDIMFADDQIASGAHVEVSGEGVFKSTQEALDKGYRMLGWWHSHANFEPFQSGIDERNTLDVLNVLALTNYITNVDEKKIFDNNIETIVNKDNIIIKDKNKALIVNINGNFILDNGSKIKDVKLITTKQLGFCYSLTVNAKNGTPSVQVALQYEKNSNIETKLMDTELDIIETDEKLMEEIKLKLKYE